MITQETSVTKAGKDNQLKFPYDQVSPLTDNDGNEQQRSEERAELFAYYLTQRYLNNATSCQTHCVTIPTISIYSIYEIDRNNRMID